MGLQEKLDEYRQGVIRRAYANPDHFVRTDPADTIAALKALK